MFTLPVGSVNIQYGFGLFTVDLLGAKWDTLPSKIEQLLIVNPVFPTQHVRVSSKYQAVMMSAWHHEVGGGKSIVGVDRHGFYYRQSITI